MRKLRNAACLAVALGSVALAGWQPFAAPDDAVLGAASPPAGPVTQAPVRRVDERSSQRIVPVVPATAVVKPRAV